MIPRPKRRAGGGNLWFRATDRPQQVTVASAPIYVIGHWDRAARRMRRCGGDLCRLCEIGLAAKPWVYVAVHLPNGDMRVMEIHARNHDLANEWLAEPDEGRGRILSVWKRGPAANSPVVLEDIGRTVTEKEDIDGFVACLGLDAQLTVQVESSLGLDREDLELAAHSARLRAQHLT